LLIGRLAYRFVRLSEPGVVAGNSAAADFGRSPLTLLIFATLVSYYAVYAMGLLRERARHGAGAK
jgi:hypothetical protein